MSAEVINNVQTYELIWSILVAAGIVAGVWFLWESYKRLKISIRIGEARSIELAAEGLLIRDVIRLLAQTCLLIPTYQAISHPARGTISTDTWLFIGALVTMEALIVANAYIDKIWSLRVIERRRRELREKTAAEGELADAVAAVESATPTEVVIVKTADPLPVILVDPEKETKREG